MSWIGLWETGTYLERDQRRFGTELPLVLDISGTRAGSELASGSLNDSQLLDSFLSRGVAILPKD